MKARRQPAGRGRPERPRQRQRQRRRRRRRRAALNEASLARKLPPEQKTKEPPEQKRRLGEAKMELAERKKQERASAGVGAVDALIESVRTFCRQISRPRSARATSINSDADDGYDELPDEVPDAIFVRISTRPSARIQLGKNRN